MKPKAKHTPGPWKFIQELISDGITKGRHYCVKQDGYYIARELLEADARFIAAAPETAAERDRLKEINAELLEALKILSQAIREGERVGATKRPGATIFNASHFIDPLVFAEAVISKAERRD